MSRAVVVDNLSIEVGDVGVVKNVSLEANEGELVCVVGSTGSGKSTILKVLAGVIPELYKGFRVCGKVSIYGMNPVEALYRGLVAYVPQDIYSFFIGSTPREELAILGVESSCCNDIDLDKDIEFLSDGQLYRFLLYSALSSGAKVIMIDEPSSHIDWWSIEEVFTCMKKFVLEKKAVIFIADHKLDVIKRFCDKVVDLDGSKKDFCNLPKIRGSMLGEVIIRLENVYVFYGKVPVLKNVSLLISSSEAVAFVGRNGAGKTTLLKVLAGIIRPSKGKTTLKKGTRIFLVPQNPIYWFPNGSIESVVEFFTERYGYRGSINKVLEMFYFDGKQSKNVYSLSIGEARLFSLALAYISNANLIIVDEPTLGLDCKAKVVLMNSINTLLENNASVIIATHDLGFAKLFNSIYVLENGRILSAR